MIKIKKITYTILTIIFLILSGLLSNQVYAARATINDFSKLTNYPTIYTMVQELKTAHPKWNFVILYTGLNWNTVITNETTVEHAKSLVQETITTGNLYDWLCPICGEKKYDNGTWYCASAKTVSYYMDPRNWLNEDYIFAFEALNYNEGTQNIDGVKAILSGTFMDVEKITYIDTAGKTQTINKSYAQIIMELAKKYDVSPYLLASRVKQEQGSGQNSLISGNYTYTDPVTGAKTVYTGYYNYFNIGASGNGEANVIKNGLERAKRNGWTTPELSIEAGADLLATDYVQSAQDSLYLQKYAIDPAGGSLYSYQYMQNVSAPFTESLSVRRAYNNLGLLESGFTFIVPVFENMPTTASVKPGRNIKLVTEDVKVSTLTMPLTIRTGPSTNYGIAGKVPKGTIITRIEKAENTSSDGRYWDKIVYSTGSEIIIGYASREYLTDVTTTEKINETKTISEMCNLRNGPGTTDSRVKQVLSKGTEVTAIDKVNINVDGHIWYRVKLSNGTQGYVSEAYLESGPVEKYKIDETYVKVTPQTKLSDIPNATTTEAKLATGAKVTIEGKEYTVIMMGDTNSDGKIDSADLLKIVRHLKETSKIELVDSADTNGDGKIDSADLLKIVRHLKGTSLLTIV